MSSKFTPQAGVLPYRHRKDRLEILIITSNSGRWIVPKGMLEPDMTPWESAAKEAWEEAGVEGIVGHQALTNFDYEKFGMRYRVDLFPLRVEKVLDTWEEMDLRERRWVSPTKACRVLTERPLVKTVKRLGEMKSWPADLP